MRAIFRPTHAALGASLRKAARTLAALLIFAAPATQVLAAPPVPAQFADIAPKVQPFVDQGQISGAVLLAADKDHVLFVSAVGESDLATHRKMQTDDMFWIASMSKPITAVAVGILVDQGKLSFDDPVEKYLPEFRDPWVVQTQTGSNFS